MARSTTTQRTSRRTTAKPAKPTAAKPKPTATGKKAAKASKAQFVRDQFEKGASLTEAAKATGVDPAYVWDLAAVWEKTSGRKVPRNGRVKAEPETTVAK